MKPKPIFSIIILLIISASFPALAQKGTMSGEWKLNKEKTTITDNSLFLSKVTVLQKQDSLFTTRVYSNEYGEEYPFKEDLSLNGRECKTVIYDMPRSTKASRSAADGSIKIESITSFYGNNGEENLTASETWKVDNEGTLLTISYINKMAGNEAAGTSYFSKIK